MKKLRKFSKIKTNPKKISKSFSRLISRSYLTYTKNKISKLIRNLKFGKNFRKFLNLTKIKKYLKINFLKYLLSKWKNYPKTNSDLSQDFTRKSTRYNRANLRRNPKKRDLYFNPNRAEKSIEISLKIIQILSHFSGHFSQKFQLNLTENFHPNLKSQPTHSSSSKGPSASSQTPKPSALFWLINFQFFLDGLF